MNPIRDDELVLFHYRDGLSPARLLEIEQAMRDDAPLSLRYQRLLELLQASAWVPPPEPAGDLAARLWTTLEPRIAEPASTGGAPAHAVAARPRWGHPHKRRSGWRLAASIAALLVVSVSFFAGRITAPPVVQGDRVFDAYVAQHLGSTRRALMVAVQAEAGTAGDTAQSPADADLAQALLLNNRMFLAAAQRKGDARLVGLLQALEPVLIELANPAPGSDIPSLEGLGEYVTRSDLIFEVRATEAGLRARTTTRI